MHAHQGRGLGADGAQGQGHVHAVIQVIAVADQVELAQLAVDRLFADTLHSALVDQPVVDQVSDGANLQAVLLSKHFQLRATSHGAVVVHDLADHSARLEPGHARQVTGRFGVPGTSQHATRLSHQRKDVARADDIVGGHIPRHRSLHGTRTVSGGNTGRHAFGGLNRHREFGAETRAVARCHQRQLKQLAALTGHGHADQAASEAGHEVDVLGGDAFRGDDDVAFVLTILVIHQDDHLAGADVFDQFCCSIQGHAGDLTYSGSRVRQENWRSGPRRQVQRLCHRATGAPGNARADPLRG